MLRTPRNRIVLFIGDFAGSDEKGVRYLPFLQFILRARCVAGLGRKFSSGDQSQGHADAVLQCFLLCAGLGCADSRLVSGSLLVIVFLA